MMISDEITERVCNALYESSTGGVREILPRMSLRVDLEFDDDELIGVLIDIEDEFAIDIDDDEWDKVLTVADVIELVKRKAEAA